MSYNKEQTVDTKKVPIQNPVVAQPQKHDAQKQDGVKKDGNCCSTDDAKKDQKHPSSCATK